MRELPMPTRLPLGARMQYRTPEVGALIAWDHGVYRVMEVRPVPRDLWSDDDFRRDGESFPSESAAPMWVVIRPAHVKGDDPKLRSKDVHLRGPGTCRWDVYPHEHYPVCAQCGEPVPCREQSAVEQAHRAAEHAARYEVAGMCPACQEPVTQRQGSRTFAENLYMPGGPPVTFHASRRECWWGLVSYEDKWVQADPDRRSYRYKCTGVATIHGDTGTYECTYGLACPGPQASHRALVGCQCPEHERGFRPRGFGGLPKDARNLATDGEARS